MHYEEEIIHEVQLLLKSQTFQYLCNAYKKGIAEIFIFNKRTIQVEPELPFSGMALFEENGFVLGKEAFKSKEELIKTLLHEIYRLETSTIRKNKKATQPEVTAETKAAFEFAEKGLLALKLEKLLKD